MKTKTKRKPRMTWRRLSLMCEAVRRVTRFAVSSPAGHWAGLGYITDYQSVLTAGWMQVADLGSKHPSAYSRALQWFVLTPAGEAIVDNLLATGLTYKHIEVTLIAPSTMPKGISCLLPDAKQLFTDPDRFLAKRAFKGEATLPDLDTGALKRLAPGGGKLSLK